MFVPTVTDVFEWFGTGYPRSTLSTWPERTETEYTFIVSAVDTRYLDESICETDPRVNESENVEMVSSVFVSVFIRATR